VFTGNIGNVMPYDGSRIDSTHLTNILTTCALFSISSSMTFEHVLYVLHKLVPTLVLDEVLKVGDIAIADNLLENRCGDISIMNLLREQYNRCRLLVAHPLEETSFDAMPDMTPDDSTLVQSMLETSWICFIMHGFGHYDDFLKLIDRKVVMVLGVLLRRQRSRLEGDTDSCFFL
jgi:hypothetical protein